MGIKKLNIVSSSFLIREGLKSVIHQLTSSYVIKESSYWNEFLENNKDNAGHQTIIIEVNIIPEKDRLKQIKHIINDGVLVILLYSDEKEIRNLKDFESISYNIPKDEFSEKLSYLLLDGKTNKPENNVLSEREFAILKEVALGLTNKEISDKLYISTHTVITHRKNITAKLGIKTISGLTVYALINNLINPLDINK